MAKKRRAWWIVGASVALFGGLAFLSVYNSTYARIERAVAQIVEEYGFEFQSPAIYGTTPTVIDTEYYGGPMDAETADEIVAILVKGCPSLEHVSFVDPDDGSNMYQHTFYTEMQGKRISRIAFVADDPGLTRPGGNLVAYLVVYKNDRPSLWQRIKGLWPW